MSGKSSARCLSIKHLAPLFVLPLVIATIANAAVEPTPKTVDVDVCVYTATPSGILAAVAVKRAGRSVVIVEPSRWVGGMLGAGLKPLQDCPNYAATGGTTHELLPSLGRNFQVPGLAKTAADGAEDAAENQGEQRVYGPDSIREDFGKLVEAYQIPVVFEHRIARCEKREGTIAAAVFDLAPFDELGCPVAETKVPSNLRVTAKMFIDASYEGDLMPAAGVGYRVGREAESEFNEPYAGVQPPMELAPIDPWVMPGKPDSGLLKWVEEDHGKPIGAADGYTQAYNYRYYTTSDPNRQYPIDPPPDYDPLEFELVGRYVAYLARTIDNPQKLRKRLVGIYPGWMNSGEWNYYRESLFSMAPLGISQIYADGDHVAHARVWKQHQDYLRGLHTFMKTDPRVPESYREEVGRLGLDARFHAETQGWPHQLYIRVSRRLRGRYTITAHDVYNETEVDDPIGLAQYGIDTYPARRIWLRQEGEVVVGIEGKMFVGGSKGPTNVPYPVPYRAITPKSDECVNLLVPVCFSATHLGYASARMEPVFMICGESAGIAACQALDEKTTVQQIDMKVYRRALEQAGQKLSWDPEVDKPTGPPRGSKPDAYSFEHLVQRCDQDGDGLVSAEEWNACKPNWEWLFAKIVRDGNGKVNQAEYAAFQKFKIENPDWATKLRAQE